MAVAKKVSQVHDGKDVQERVEAGESIDEDVGAAGNVSDDIVEGCECVHPPSDILQDENSTPS